MLIESSDSEVEIRVGRIDDNVPLKEGSIRGRSAAEIMAEGEELGRMLIAQIRKEKSPAKPSKDASEISVIATRREHLDLPSFETPSRNQVN